ncbi:hypothetical protein PsorP6_012210 [Peronosclerospora sorghi]|uniref:Uncharacterized protein n=1 Tax=Peronosclerospora sorghi TaxID=230839 RepID=A0ACC0WJG4_9STRA|nr:hypothetical protein PsorP6_012210 [Peronosclerospora sorghi]
MDKPNDRTERLKTLSALTHFSPFEIDTGRKPRNPVFEVESNQVMTSKCEVVNRMLESRNKIIQRAREHLLYVQ